MSDLIVPKVNFDPQKIEPLEGIALEETFDKIKRYYNNFFSRLTKDPVFGQHAERFMHRYYYAIYELIFYNSKIICNNWVKFADKVGQPHLETVEFEDPIFLLEQIGQEDVICFSNHEEALQAQTMWRSRYKLLLHILCAKHQRCSRKTTKGSHRYFDMMVRSGTIKDFYYLIDWSNHPEMKWFPPLLL